MNGIVYHIVSGHAFFTGIACVILAVWCSTQSHPVCQRVTLPGFLVGALLVVLSSTAISYWYYGLLSVVALGWMVTRFKPIWRKPAAILMAIVWLSAIVLELPYHITPTLNPVASRTLTVIGDSVTAGVGGNESSNRWPNLLSEQHQIEVQDISHMGETAASALKRAKSHSIQSSIVLVEIGGNDVLGSTSSAQFAKDLDSLLNHLVDPNRQIIMFELPLPPLYHEFGRIQRTIAAKHHVALIPKRIFLSVIAGGGSTLDSIHLSQSGHQAMADSVWNCVDPAFDKSSGQ